MKKLNDFLKHIKIHQFCETLPGLYESNLKEVSAYFEMLNTHLYGDHPIALSFTEYRNIVVTDHAYKRWNERVSTKLEINQLTSTLQNLLYMGRIDLLENNLGVIDDEIVFIYDNSHKHSLVIKTFYGRISQVKSLANFNSLRAFNSNQSDHIDISLSTELLGSLIAMPLPYKRIVFQGTVKEYILEEYKNEERSLFILLSKDAAGTTIRKFYSDHPAILLEHSVRRALMILKHERVVREQIHFQYPKSQIS